MPIEKELMPHTFWDHLGELRSRLLKTLLVIGIVSGLVFIKADWLLKLLIQPLPVAGFQLSSLQPASVFVQTFKLALLGGLVLSLPVVFYQIWAFVVPGLTSKETKALLWSLSAGTFLFVIGALFAYLLVVPKALKFFLGYSQYLGITPAWTVEHYLNFVLMFLLSFGLAFELPLILVLLVFLNIVSPESLRAKRPYIIVGLAIVAALLTPPDVVSQLFLLIPLWLLFEFSLFIAKF